MHESFPTRRDLLLTVMAAYAIVVTSLAAMRFLP